jgi:two-component system, NarL family, response regulator NreC
VDFRNGTRRTVGPRHPDVAAAPPTPLQTFAALAGQSRYARRGVPVSNEIIRVLLVDDHAIVRDGLRALLKSAPDIQVVGEAGDGQEAMTVAQRTAPDVVIMDLDMPGVDGTTATAELTRLDVAPKILILTMHAEEERLVPLLKAGARGFLSKDCAEGDLLDAIRAVAANEFFVRPSVARILAANAMPHARSSTLEDVRRRFELLSARERTVLKRVAEGYSGVEIGRMLDITPKTVDTYKNRIGEKLGFTHRTDYVRFALRLGLLEAENGQQNADAVSALHRQPGL